MIDLVFMLLLSLSDTGGGVSETSSTDCVVPVGSETPKQDCPLPIGNFRKYKNYVFDVFVVCKCICLSVKLITMIKRYHMTHKTYNLPEVYFVAVTLLKVTILLPNYFLHEMNTIYFVFLLNSLCSYFLTYILSQRTCVTLELEVKKVRCNKIGFIL